MAYSNSPLITYSKISPNRNSPRNHKIDTITIHCMATQWTAKQCCDYFSKSSSQASSNYCVGKDGSIGLSVPESDRSWCTSSRTNDNRAITIEVASNSSSPYKVTTKAYNALIDLLVDICKRNGIKRLLWQADKSLIGETSKQNMTVHRWFANKSCPGNYLYNKHSQIASEVNARLTDTTPETSSDPEYIWKYFMSVIGNEYGVAGLMGNLYAESGLLPNNLQNSFEESLGFTDSEYTDAVNDGTYTEEEFVNDSAGYGLAQWTYYSRKQGLYDMFKEGGYSSIGSVELACDYLYHELATTYTDVLETLKNATSIREASDKVLHDFERPADQSTNVEEKRYEYAVSYYDEFANRYQEGVDGEDWEGITHKDKKKLLLMAVVTDRF